MALSTRPTVAAVLALVVAERQRRTGLAGLARHALFCLRFQFFNKASKNPF